MTEFDPKRIDGKKISDDILKELEHDIKLLKEQSIVPGLAVVLVGERKDSATYVRMKKQAAEKIGINFKLVQMPIDVTEEKLLETVHNINEDKSIHGLIVQLPLPSHINEKKVLDSVGLDKDVDGFHPLNIGSLAMKGREPAFISCTPKGIMELLDRTKIDLDGKHVVIIGRSNIVGIPVSLLCLNHNATITICHSHTHNIAELTKTGDVVIAAVGKAKMVKKDWVKEGAVVIDVGTNPVDDPNSKTGYRLVGDVDYEEVKTVASKITPVPGGVGPMTVAMLLQNTVISAKRHIVEKKDEKN